jgi:hypothetical protein
VALLIFEDEDGGVLWERPDAEFQPPGTMVTDHDGTRYFVVKIRANHRRDRDGQPAYRVLLRPLN